MKWNFFEKFHSSRVIPFLANCLGLALRTNGNAQTAPVSIGFGSATGTMIVRTVPMRPIAKPQLLVAIPISSDALRPLDAFRTVSNATDSRTVRMGRTKAKQIVASLRIFASAKVSNVCPEFAFRAIWPATDVRTVLMVPTSAAKFAPHNAPRGSFWTKTAKHAKVKRNFPAKIQTKIQSLNFFGIK